MAGLPGYDYIAQAYAGFTDLIGEGNLMRLPLGRRVGRTALGMLISGGLTFAWYWAWHKVALAVLFTGELSRDAMDGSLVSLRYRIGAFAMGGFACGLGPMIVRKGEGWLVHIMAGIASGKGDGIKILGDGELTRKLTVCAHAFSASARSRIEKAGGVCELVGRPAATSA